MKKLINAPADVVAQSLAGFAAAHVDIVTADLADRVCRRLDRLPQGQVALVSGGGSGHEPLHAGFVGPGMLTAAVLGDVFASPTADQVLTAIRAVEAGAGVLLIVKNYTGDVINFRLAAEMAEDDGIQTRVVIVDDDVAVGERAGRPGRRGTAATVFVEKIVGARAAEGASLEELAELATRVVDRSRSIGLALTSCVTPMAGRPTFDLGPAEIEFGVGIHGEAGARRQPHAPAEELAAQLVGAAVADLRPDAGAELLVFTNGFGGTPVSELYLLHGDVLEALRARGLDPVRSLVGSYVTSLDMAGASVSLLQLDPELIRYWDAPVRTAALTRG